MHQKFTIPKVDKYKYIFALSDFLILLLSIVISTVIINIEFNSDYLGLIIDHNHSLLFLFSISFGLLFIFFMNHLYQINVIVVRAKHLGALLKSFWYFSIILLLAFLILSNLDFPLSLFVILNFIASSIVLLYVLRVEVLGRMYLKLKNRHSQKNILIVGNGKPGRLLAAKFAFEDPMGINIIGFVEDSKVIGEEVINGKRILGKMDNIKELVHENKVDEILIVQETKDYNELINLMERCQIADTSIKISSNLFNIIPQKLYTEKYANISVMNVSSNYKNINNLLFKRWFDIIGSILGLFILSPMLILVSLIIKLTSKGPVFFKQTRIGKDGKPFMFYKFRSMYIADEDDEKRKQEMIKFMKGNLNLGSNKKVINKKRITWIGGILRKTSLDEMPQLINVLLGDMSLVGPRPCLPYEFENYDNWQRKRLNVLPGCTGVWQVMGRSSVSFNDSIVLDLYYINNMSPWLDFQLIMKTIPVMLFARGGE
jgi:undecaprenyl-phosphate galactose phosphotransferase